MLLTGKVLAGRVETITTKKGPLAKTKLKIVDMGDETDGDLTFYWIDFLGDASLTDAQLDAVAHKEVTVEVRRFTVTLGNNGKAYLNVAGGAILDAHGQPMQAKLQARRAAA